MRILHLSDVHMQIDYHRAKWGPLGWRRWAALVEMLGMRRSARYERAQETLRVLAREPARLGVDHTVLSGDLTAMGLDDEFVMARQALGSLAEDERIFSVIPGNHDVYAYDSWDEQRFQKHFGHLLKSDWPEYCREGPYPYVRTLGDQALVVGLTSARVPLSPGIAAGWMGRAQLDGLARLLADPRVGDRMVFVAVHHAPANPRGRPDIPTHALYGARELLELLPGERFAVLYGHIHHRYWHKSDGKKPHLFCAGSSTEKGDEGYWLYEVRNRRLASAHMLKPGENPPSA
jgi:3',5'-cyclic AMP phosphodiesterase CpdA